MREQDMSRKVFFLTLLLFYTPPVWSNVNGVHHVLFTLKAKLITLLQALTNISSDKGSPPSTKQLNKSFFLYKPTTTLNNSKFNTIRTCIDEGNKKYGYNYGYSELFLKFFDKGKPKESIPEDYLELRDLPKHYTDCLLGQGKFYGRVYRRFFELKAAEFLKNNLNMPSYTYLSIGSDTLFQDFTLLDQLTNTGHQVSSIILIDNNNDYKEVVSQQKITQRTKFIEQFGIWFNSYPILNNKFAIYVFSSIEDYVRSLDTNVLLKADIVVCADVHSDFQTTQKIELMGNSVAKYIYKTALKENGSMIYLSHDIRFFDTLGNLLRQDPKDEFAYTRSGPACVLAIKNQNMSLNKIYTFYRVPYGEENDELFRSWIEKWEKIKPEEKKLEEISMI